VEVRRRLKRLLASALIPVIIGAALPHAVVAADDITAPVGTVTIGDGSGYASSLDLTVHAPATDDVGVVSMAIFANGVPIGVRPYEPTTTVSVSQASLWDIGVQWQDAAGNSSVGHAQVQVDVTPPNIGFLRFYEDTDPTDRLIPASIGNAWDDGSPIANVRFRTGSGAWGTPLAATSDNPMVIDWPAYDPVYGGSPTIGPRTVSVQVQNAAGMWSPTISEPLNVSPSDLAVSISADRRTGHPVTITPSFPSDLTFAPGMFCRWEFRWGTTTALDTTFGGDTFGGLLFDVPAASGGCGPWTVTLPWVPYRQFDVIVELGQIEPDGGMAFGPRAHARFTAAVGTTERRILASSLPIAQVLPSTYTPIVGQPITYTRYLVGGASACCNARWVARLGDGENPKQWTQSGGATFTFTPSGPGELFVGWDRQAASGLLLAGYYDPPVRYRDRTAPNTTAPVARLGGGSLGSTIPVTLSWSGTDTGWGIAAYQLQQSINGGAWTSVALPSATSRTIARALNPGVEARYRVRARDKAGNYGAWDYGPTFKAVIVSDSNGALRYAGTWSRAADVAALGGFLHESTQSGASVTFTWGARDFAWVAERGPDHGKARVYIDGVLVASVDLYAATPQSRRFVFTRHFATLGTHTIRIVGLGTTGRPRISFDGLAVIR
jgi:hypothetical protein